MSFFIRSSAKNVNFIGKGQKRKGNRGKKDQNKVGPEKQEKGKKANVIIDEDVHSESDSDHRADHESSGEEETVQEKRLRLTKKYLEEIKTEEKNRADNAEFRNEAIATRLREDVDEYKGRLQKLLADNLEKADTENIVVLRCKDHKLPITCLVISSDDKFLFTGSKDCGIVKWSLQDGKKLKSLPGGRKGTEHEHIGHTAVVMCLAITTDSSFLASGDQNKLIHIWNPETLDHLHKFSGHRGAISGLAFRRGTHQLFSSSHDRVVKIWNLDEMAFVENLFGHQDSITAIDTLLQERAITSGGRDRTIRVWKVIEESQLVFNGHSGSIDCVKLINEQQFLSCGDDGILSLWTVTKKKPLCNVFNAHGVSEVNGQPNWISSITALQNTDLMASGSHDGFIRVWKCGDHFKSLIPLFTIPVTGFVNTMAFTSSGNHLVAGIGQEHRLGRWWRIKEAKNCILIIPLKKKLPIQNLNGITARSMLL